MKVYEGISNISEMFPLSLSPLSPSLSPSPSLTLPLSPSLLCAGQLSARGISGEQRLIQFIGGDAFEMLVDRCLWVLAIQQRVVSHEGRTCASGDKNNKHICCLMLVDRSSVGCSYPPAGCVLSLCCWWIGVAWWCFAVCLPIHYGRCIGFLVGGNVLFALCSPPVRV